MRNTCYFCGREYGKCTCESELDYGNGKVLFQYGGMHIDSPGVSECGRWYVDPVAEYGEAYLEWSAEHPDHYFSYLKTLLRRV